MRAAWHASCELSVGFCLSACSFLCCNVRIMRAEPDSSQVERVAHPVASGVGRTAYITLGVGCLSCLTVAFFAGRATVVLILL